MAEAVRRGRGPCEVGFFGGAFTAAPSELRQLCLDFVTTSKQQGLLARARCSTRPDAVPPDVLQALRAAGMDMVELGIQSFNDASLRASGRGCDSAAAFAACEAVADADLALGVQLLPGLPGGSPESFLQDVRTTAALARRFGAQRLQAARLYPCQVVEGSLLASRFARGEYAPWPLGETIERLAEACLLLWREGVRVIRMGLAPEPALEAAILAGPRHPALGQRVRSLALLRHAAARLAALPPGTRLETLWIPRRCQGEILGWRRELADAWTALGAPPRIMRFHEGEVFIASLAAPSVNE